MRLAQMTAEQAMAHYKALIIKRMTRADEERAAVKFEVSSSNAQRRLLTKVRKASDRAYKMSFKGQWQVEAAADLYQTYGVNVAVGFLRAYGWEHSPELFRSVTGKRLG